MSLRQRIVLISLALVLQLVALSLYWIRDGERISVIAPIVVVLLVIQVAISVVVLRRKFRL